MPSDGCVRGIHHVEMYVANCYQAAHFYRTALGFAVVGRLAAHDERRTSVAMTCGDIRLLLTAPTTVTGEIADHLRVHGEGVKDVALVVENLTGVFDRAIRHGARALTEPAGDGRTRAAQIGACGDLIHSLIEGDSLPWPPPGYVPADVQPSSASPHLRTIDHVAWAVAEGQLDPLVDFYATAFGLERSHTEDVSTEYSAMRSKVVQTPDATVQFPIMEPAPGRRVSQIEAFVTAHGGPGVQHLAFRCDDIAESASAVGSDLEFLPTPDTYYEALPSRISDLPADLAVLRRHGVLIDRDSTGVLLQIFTKPIVSRPTLFLEMVERRGAVGFGSGNIKALFEAVERTQTEAPVRRPLADAAIA